MNGVRRFFATNLISPLSPSTPDSPSDPTIRFSKPVDNNPAKQSSPPSNNNSYEPTTRDDNHVLPLNIPARNISALVIRKDDTGSSARGFLREDRPIVAGNLESSKTTSEVSEVSTQDLIDKLHLDLEPGHTMDSPKPVLTSENIVLGPVSPGLNVREDLLFSLLTSEAMVDTRDCKILTAEEVDELKQEQQSLASRIGTIKQKLALELKIRNASHNLQKLKSLKITTDSIDNKPSVNDKLDAINAELVQTLEVSFRVDRKLLQHHAGVLGQSVRSLERKLFPDSPKHTPNPSLTDTSSYVSGIHTRSSSAATSISNRTKFEGAHLFAGHARSILPTSSSRRNSSADKSRIAALEENLKVTDKAKKSAEAKLASLNEEIQQLLQQKAELDKSYGIQLQQAQDLIHDLEGQVDKSLDASNVQEQWEHDKLEWDNERQQWQSQLSQWHLERETWKQTEQQWDIQHQQLDHTIQSQKDVIVNLEKNIDELAAVGMTKEELDQLVTRKDHEFQQIHEVIEQERALWEAERVRLEEEVQRAQSSARDSHSAETELLELREISEELIDLHDISHDPQDKAVLNIMSSIRNHLTLLTTKNRDLVEDKSALEDQIRLYEASSRKNSEAGGQFHPGLDELDQLGYGTFPSAPTPGESFDRKGLPQLRITPSDLPIDTGSQEYQKMIHSLKALWAVLPSVESRAPNLPKGGSISPVSAVMASSLSDLDVRALKSLYDTKQSFVSPIITDQFSIDEFVRRVHALINDDRALIERLLRFAQSHDLLRNNAERAQKLAQESNKGLEMYQAQVKALEERSALLTRKQLTMLDEINNLQQSLNIIGKEKRDLEIETIDQQSTIQRLTEANNMLNSRGFPLAEEIGSLAITVKLEAQLSEMRTKLQETQDEFEHMRAVESSQRVALLDELNSLQQENNLLREQLRNRK